VHRRTLLFAHLVPSRAGHGIGERDWVLRGDRDEPRIEAVSVLRKQLH
jgi:hypothetical protein